MPFTPSSTPSGDTALPGRILIVDDDKSICLLVSRILTAHGHNVDVANNVDEAIQVVVNGSYDVVFVDLHMPRKNGLDLLRYLQELQLDAIPILLTGTTDVGAAVKAIKDGAFDYLPKPAEPEALLWTANRAIGVVRARRREQSLQRIVNNWAATFDACPDLILVLDSDGAVLRANRTARSMICDDGYIPTGQKVEMLFSGSIGEIIRSCLVEVRNNRTELKRQCFLTDINQHYLLSLTPLELCHNKSLGIILVGRNISDLVEAEQIQANLFRKSLTAQEDERRRIARELHDGIAQTVVSLVVGLRTLVERSHDPDTHSQLNRLESIATEALEEIRRLAQDLRPLALDDLGLLPALTRLGEIFTSIHKVNAQIIVGSLSTDRLTREIESAVYRIVQESLANVAKYARANTVDVILDSTDEQLRVSIVDDGIGFNPDERNGTTHGHGLLDIRERVNSLKGTSSIDSRRGNGTSIDIWLPIGVNQHEAYIDSTGGRSHSS